MDARYVAGKIELSRRSDKLTFGHHAAIARVAAVERQQGWIDKTIENKWTIETLHAAITKAQCASTFKLEKEVKKLRRALESAFTKAPAEHHPVLLREIEKLVAEASKWCEPELEAPPMSADMTEAAAAAH